MGQYEELASTMAGLKGRAILTINDHADMRRLFDRFDGRTVPIRYTIGKGGRRRGGSESTAQSDGPSWSTASGAFVRIAEHVLIAV